MTQKPKAKRTKAAESKARRDAEDYFAERKGSGTRTRARKQKRKYHKSALLPPSHRRMDKRLFRERLLRPKDVPAAKALFAEVWEQTGYISEACERAGIGRKTYYDWIHEDPEFREACRMARRRWRATVIPDLETSFAERGFYKDTLAGIFVLKHNTKRYREVSRVQLTGADGGPILTLDAKEELIRRLEKMLARKDDKPVLTAGGVEVREGSGSKGLRVLRAGESEGPKVRRARGVSYG